MTDALFIVGYYRSGTSALSGALQRLGVKFYNEADPNEHNPLGFYEIPELIQFDVELFNRLGVDWTDVRGLPEGWHQRADIAPFLTRLDEILRRRFSKADALWGLKHPHLCRTLPLYERAARQSGHTPHVVHIFRDPWTAAASQQHKNGLTRAHALLLWMEYITTGECCARHLPRSWLTYHDLLSKPLDQLRRIEQELGISLTQRVPNGLRDAASHLTFQLNRSEPLPHEDLNRPLRALVNRAWNAILARDSSPALWDDFARETSDMVGFLTEIGASRARVIPAFGGGGLTLQQNQLASPAPEALRPAERLDAGGKLQLLAMRDVAAALPRIGIVIIAPPGRAPAVNDTLESLNAQWHAADTVRIIAADPIALPGRQIIPTPGESGAPTRTLCETLSGLAHETDYVAVLNAGDTLTPDACLRFALLAAETAADLLYCDEIVPRDHSFWVRHKPGWDITRLRQSAYLGDWVWYRAKTLLRLGGFDAACAGAEEYDYQLRLAEHAPAVARLSEALFQRSPESRRDNIPAEEFCARAASSITRHLTRAGIPATVQNRQHLGLFHHLRLSSDPGTSIILLCDGASIAEIDGWMTRLLTGSVLSGPILLTADEPDKSTTSYLCAVAQQAEELEGKVLAIPPAEATPGQGLVKALSKVATTHVAILDARALPVSQHWLEALRARLADPGVALAAARALVKLDGANQQFTVQGPLVIGADTRLGAGHLADDPGPGGWLSVDQEASAIAPPALLARSLALAACTIPALKGDALWTDLCAQIRGAGGRIVWTPDVSFIAPIESVALDTHHDFCQGSDAARSLSWADPYHHPALSLHGNLLAPEQRPGLVRASPAAPHSLLVTGAPETGAAVLNMVRNLRGAGLLAASWAPDLPTAPEIGRLAPSSWVRVNPEQAPGALHPPYTAMFTQRPEPAAKPAIAAAARCFGTSPGLVRSLRRLSAPGKSVGLWRPALSPGLWDSLAFGTGLNTKPRVLWVDEGIAPLWFQDLVRDTLDDAAWIAVARPDAALPGAVARIAMPADEHGWAQALAETAPHIMVRPAGTMSDADHYPALLAAAAGCHILADDRLDLPPELGALRLPNRIVPWQRALQSALQNLTATLAHGKRARMAALALAANAPPPPWAEIPAPACIRNAAE